MVFTIVQVVVVILQTILLNRTDALVGVLKPIISAAARLSLEFANTKSGVSIGLCNDATEILVTLSNDGKQVANDIVLEFAFDPEKFDELGSDIEFLVMKHDSRFNRESFVPTKAMRPRRSWEGLRLWSERLKSLLLPSQSRSQLVPKADHKVKPFPLKANVIQIVPTRVLHPKQSMEMRILFRFNSSDDHYNAHRVRYNIFCTDFQPRLIVNETIFTVRKAS